jgi:hypothetical protein
MEDDEIIYKKQKKVFYFLLIIAVLFTIFYVRQENEITRKLNRCSFYSLITPIRMPDNHKLYFSFIYKGQIIKSSTSLGADDAGLTYTKRSVMSKRYFVRVFCDDLQVNRVQWDVPVPDTLQYIPPNGWAELPYGLDSLGND